MFEETKYKYYHDIIECLVSALEAKDVYTKGHSDRVAQMASDIAFSMGFTGERLDKIHIAGHLHDIGKIGISDAILNKTGKLTFIEYEMMKKHSEMGYEIIKKSKELEDIAIIVRHHHEAYDGSGYPDGLKGDQIPLESRILAVSDAIDAMTSQRLYRHKVSMKACREEIERCSGGQFDPVIVNAIVNLWPKWEDLKANQDFHDPSYGWCSNA
ncbi:HD-GYP domain-containing protein [Fusibacter sp. 3D3]|uniref:HD-GYP domain-containing protein n=1 Tax=Fusibacter sp. 3D3 TaxID=1048380 RepID=UPI000852D20B|nr:HD-GYP domain-containing protein [Fusibacter sp. 3D3]GAU77119.1 HD-GYP domain [Fusibacter sp. 3D3]